MNDEYECAYCGSGFDDDDNVIFIDRAFTPSGNAFCSTECLLLMKVS